MAVCDVESNRIGSTASFDDEDNDDDDDDDDDICLYGFDLIILHLAFLCHLIFIFCRLSRSCIPLSHNTGRSWFSPEATDPTIVRQRTYSEEFPSPSQSRWNFWMSIYYRDGMGV